jgi:hypothetical protein
MASAIVNKADPTFRANIGTNLKNMGNNTERLKKFRKEVKVMLGY